jgi:enolase-phosphatase E1
VAVVNAVVVDIEGTTSSSWFVFDHLYPYSRERFPEWIDRRDDIPDVNRAYLQVADLIGVPSPSTDEVVSALNGWLAADQKVTPLKTIQGLIWNEGFEKGDLVSDFYSDVIPALRRWHADGYRLYVFSSGSLKAQRAWFGHTPEGDLLPLFSGHFDTESAGPKRIPDSYRSIALQLGIDPGHAVFLSDLDVELDAAAQAGWQTVGIRRPGEEHFDRGIGQHPEVSTFDDIVLSKGA